MKSSQPSAQTVHLVPSARRATEDTPPKTIFHYTNVSAFRDIIAKGELWATSLRYMNDAAELRHAADLFVKAINLSDMADPHKSDFVEAMRGLEKMHNVFAVAFCQDSDLLSQWRSYAGHSGVAIGFDTEWLLKRFGEINFRIQRCIYDEEKKDELVQEVMKKVLELLGGGEVTSARANLMNHFVRLAPLLKHISFNEEQEWRLVSFPIPNSTKGERYRSGNTALIPYYSLRLSDVSPAKAKQEKQKRFSLTRVVLGPTVHPELSRITTIRFLEHCCVSCGEVGLSKSPLRSRL